MAPLVVDNLEDEVRNKLRDLARSHGRCMEEEVRDILRGAVLGQHGAGGALGSRLARCFAADGLEQDIRELRGQPAKPPTFDPGIMIAGVVAARHATLATRNTKHFIAAGIPLVNPWQGGVP
jgi:plasmid stability protein